MKTTTFHKGTFKASECYILLILRERISNCVTFYDTQHCYHKVAPINRVLFSTSVDIYIAFDGLVYISQKWKKVNFDFTLNLIFLLKKKTVNQTKKSSINTCTIDFKKRFKRGLLTFVVVAQVQMTLWTANWNQDTRKYQKIPWYDIGRSKTKSPWNCWSHRTFFIWQCGFDLKWLAGYKKSCLQMGVHFRKLAKSLKDCLELFNPHQLLQFFWNCDLFVTVYIKGVSRWSCSIEDQNKFTGQ